MLMLILLNGKDYYGLPIYPILFCFGCVYLERLTIKKTILRVLMLAVSISLSIVDLPMELPITNPGRLAMIYKKYHYERFGILKWEDGRNHLIKQDFADMLGWKEIAGKTMAAFNGLTLQDQKKTIIYRSNYGICGAINFYTKDSSFPGSYTDNASFVMWMPRQFEFEHVLFVGHAIPDRWLPRFKAVQVLGELNSVYARESGLKIFLFEQADSSFHSLLHQMIFNKKNEFLF
jgi:hypothetical protein